VRFENDPSHLVTTLFFVIYLISIMFRSEGIPTNLNRGKMCQT